MLILTRKPGESLYIGDNVKITVVEVKGPQIRLGIDAPRELPIYREEIYEQIREENKQAAALSEDSDVGLDSLSAAWGKKHSGTSQGGASTKLSGIKLKPQGDGDEGKKKPEVIKRRNKREDR